jgi:hypothetical protein
MPNTKKANAIRDLERGYLVFKRLPQRTVTDQEKVDIRNLWNDVGEGAKERRMILDRMEAGDAYEVATISAKAQGAFDTGVTTMEITLDVDPVANDVNRTSLPEAVHSAQAVGTEATYTCDLISEPTEDEAIA